ncbi:protein ABHD17B-like [Iris pallida]|uniref:Protein ABHD17B-like n=1 Tax=Iris pallida TaxID=29817 RepID=A0AAX6HER0_IRIPA|nr:protein ABHD17B-like [Iris pallida]
MGGITSSIAARFAFFPPTPASYQLAGDPDTDGAPSIPEISAFSSSCSSPSQHDVLRVRTRKGHDVVAVHVRNARATDHAALLPRQRGRPRPDVPAPRRSQRLVHPMRSSIFPTGSSCGSLVKKSTYDCG